MLTGYPLEFPSPFRPKLWSLSSLLQSVNPSGEGSATWVLLHSSRSSLSTGVMSCEMVFICLFLYLHWLRCPCTSALNMHLTQWSPSLLDVSMPHPKLCCILPNISYLSWHNSIRVFAGRCQMDVAWNVSLDMWLWIGSSGWTWRRRVHDARGGDAVLSGTGDLDGSPSLHDGGGHVVGWLCSRWVAKSTYSFPS